MAKSKNKIKKTIDRYAGNENCPPKLAELLAVAGRAGIDSVDVAAMLGFSRVMLYFIIAGTQTGSKLTWKKVEVLKSLLTTYCEAGTLPILFNKPDRHNKTMAMINSLKSKIERVKLETDETGIKVLPKKDSKKPVIKPLKVEKVKKLEKPTKVTKPKPVIASVKKAVVKPESKKATQPAPKPAKKASKPISKPKADESKPAVSSSIANLIASASEL